MSESRVTADLSALDDTALVSAFVAGERAAFDAIVARHQRHVYQLCFRFVRNHEDAADLADGHVGREPLEVLLEGGGDVAGVDGEISHSGAP